ncbi:hypothetical protein IH992_09835 [Candidatus Poribacteria bacterium]|nr:hypothetical protein [Candidatus Poribacteria bacterium]
MNQSLPTLTVNRSFIAEFIDADAPCVAMGMIQENDQQYGLLALRPSEPIPAEVTARGFSFGHSMFGSDRFEVIHFAFHFVGYQTYNVLVNPNNRIVQKVVAHMIDSGDYFFLILNPDNGVTTFRSEVGRDNLSELKSRRRRIQLSTTSLVQYEQGVSAFVQNPDNAGIVVNWVCRDNVEYLDLSNETLELNPV